MQLVQVPVQRQHEVLLRREVVVGAAQRDTGLQRDRAHGRRLVAMLAKELEGGAEDCRPRLLALGGRHREAAAPVPCARPLPGPWA